MTKKNIEDLGYIIRAAICPVMHGKVIMMLRLENYHGELFYCHTFDGKHFTEPSRAQHV